MSDRFKVGDRVRIIKSQRGEMVGLEAIILSVKCPGVYYVDVDGYGPAPSGRPWQGPEDWLAPIYDGWDKTEWKDCYWKPKILEKVG